ncbi:MAG: TolC family protein [Desulfobacteraceae bacterium]|jgi:TolC family type I secretion outer membrane protein
MDKLFKNLQNNLIAIVAALMVLGWSQTGWSQPPSSATDLENIKVLDLQTAARIALEDNPSLAAAQARVGQAREAVRQARSTYWPRFDLTASQTRVDLSDNAFASQAAIYQAFNLDAPISNPEDYYQVGVTASWLIFDGFTRWFNLAAAKHGEQSSAAARNDARRLLLQAVSSAFVSAQLSLENVAIAKADEAFNQRQLTEAKLRHEVGTGALSDVLNFEVKANSAQSDRIVAERAYETSRIGLAALLGIKSARLPEDTQLEGLEEASAAELEMPQPDQLLEEAYNRRPDLMQNVWVVRQAEADVKAKRGSYFPTISLAASYDGENTDDFGFESDDFGTSVGVNLSYNIFAGGLFHARHQEAKMRLREAEKGRENVKINVTSEVQTTTQRLLSAQKQLLLQRTNARLVQKNRDLVEKEYKAGVGSLVRLNEAQRDLTAAQVRLAAAQVALRQAWYDLWSATGQIETQLVASE